MLIRREKLDKVRDIWDVPRRGRAITVFSLKAQLSLESLYEILSLIHNHRGA